MNPVHLESRALIRNALPLIAGFAGMQLASLVDTAMVGRLGAPELAGVSVGSGLFFAGAMVGMGCILGMDPLVTQAVGAAEIARSRQILNAGLRIAMLLALPIMIIVGVSPLALELLGIETETATLARHYVWARLPNLLPFFLFAAQRGYLQAHGYGSPIVWATVISNVVNVFANGLLIYGDRSLLWFGLPAVGLPELGVIGAGLASSISGAMTYLVAMVAVKRIDRRAPPSPSGADEEGLERRILHLGWPIGITMLAEVGAFAISGLMAARLGATEGAAHQVAITLASFSFTVCLGVAAATTVRVGQAVGRGDSAGARLSGFVGLGSGSAFMAISAVVFLLWSAPLARLLTDQTEIVEMAAPLVMIAAAFQLSDGAQVVAAGALRGIGDTRFVRTANIIGHYVFSLPLAALLAFGLNWRAPGIWWGLSLGLTLVGVALIARFHRMSRGVLLRV